MDDFTAQPQVILSVFNFQCFLLFGLYFDSIQIYKKFEKK